MAVISQLGLVILLVASLAVSVARAQFGRPTTKRPVKLSLVHIDVTLYCTPDGNIGPLGQKTPPFPNAMLLLQCTNGHLLANATTNVFGTTYLVTKPTPALPFSQNDCKLIVNTTLSSCDLTLPSTGRLESPLTFKKTIFQGNTKISSFKPKGFHYTKNPFTSPVKRLSRPPLA